MSNYNTTTTATPPPAIHLSPTPEAVPAAAAPPKRKMNLLPILGVVGTAVVIILAVWFLNRNKQTTDDAFVEAHVTQISPEISENVVKVYVTDNQRVKKGDVLLDLDSRNEQAMYAQAAANLASDEAKLVQAKAQLESAKDSFAQSTADINQAKANSDNAAITMTRSVNLHTKGVVAQQDLDNAHAQALSTAAALDGQQKKAMAAQSAVVVSEAAVKSAEAQVALAKALIDTATLRLSFTRIYAPQDGRVTRKNVEPGSYVQTGNALMAVVSNDMWVVANYKETQLDHMRDGQPVEIRLDAYPSLRLRGKVDSMQSGSGSRFSLLPAENATGNYVKVVQRVPVKITFLDAPDMPDLGPGMSAVTTVDTTH